MIYKLQNGKTIKRISSVARDTKKLIKHILHANTSDDLKVTMDDMASLSENMPEPMRKRAIETALRVSGGGNPGSVIRQYSYSGKPLKDAIYIATGVGSPSVNDYNGLYTYGNASLSEEYKDAIRPDIIDAIVYGKKVNPTIGVQIDSPEEDYGVETNYIKRTFPDKKVQYIETRPPIDLVDQNGIESKGIVPASLSGSFKTSDPDIYINNQGFVGEYGTRNDSTFVRGFDVYDFASNPGDRSGYKSKWGVAPSGTEKSSNDLIDIVNANTNPLVIRTPWVPVDRIGDIIRDITVNVKNQNLDSLPSVVNSIFKSSSTTHEESESGYSSGGKIHIKPKNRNKLFKEDNPDGKNFRFGNIGVTGDGTFMGFDLHKNGGIIKLQNGRTIPLGGDYLEYLQSIPETYGGSIQPSVKTESLPKKFNGSQQAARTYAEGYQKGAKPVTKAINNAGQKIFNTTKNVAMFVPGPTGAITWLGQMGADTANGEYSKVAKDLGAAVLIGAGLKGAQAGAKAVGKTLAGKGVNIPWLDAYDYSALRGQYLDRTANKVMRSLDKSPIKHIPIYHGTNYLGDDLRWFSGGDAGLHVGTTSSPALSFIKRPGYVIREGFVEVNPKEVVKINEDLGGWNRTSFDTQRGREVLPEKINEIIKNSDPLDYARGTDKELRQFNKTFDINPTTTEADPEGLSVVSNYKRNYTLANELSNNGVKIIDYPNEFEGVFGNRSLMITDPKRYVFAKHRLYEPKPISPQETATTYHFDGKIPLSRPISEAELKGWPKQLRNQRRGQISASEYSGLPKGERNNGRYGGIRFIRHMDVVPELTEDGFVQVAPEQNYFANFTTDQLMVSHEGYPVELVGKNALIISPEAFRGTTPFSLDPGDSFFVNSELKIKPKHVTFVSGDETALQLARDRGFNVITSPKLKILFPLAKPMTQEQLLDAMPALEKRGYGDTKFGGSYRDFTKVKSDYVDELRRVINSNFSRPRLNEYSYLKEITGIPTNTYLRETAPFEQFFGPKTGYEQVIYDTTPIIEGNITKQIGAYPHPKAESMKNWSPGFFRLLRGWKPIKKQGGKI